jgi:hypothetical protein
MATKTKSVSRPKRATKKTAAKDKQGNRTLSHL